MQYNIVKQMEKRNISAQELAKKTNLSPSVISKFINGQSELSFVNMLTIASYFEPNPLDEVQFMERYIQNCQKPDNIRAAMEYTARNFRYDLLKGLIDRGMESRNSLTQEYSRYYDILYNRRISGAFHESFHEIFVETNIHNAEMIVFKSILLAYYYLDLYQVKMMEQICHYIKKTAHLVQNDYMRESFLTRGRELWGFVLLNDLNMVESRTVLMRALKANTYLSPFNTFTYHTLALTYFHENPQKSILYFQNAAEICSKFKNDNWHKTILERRIPLVKVYHDLDITEDEIPDKEIRAFFLAKNGKKEEALQLFKEIKRSEYTDFYESFCYDDTKGLALLVDSLIHFERKGDRFSALMAEKELLVRRKKVFEKNDAL